MSIYEKYTNITWADVKRDDIVFIDNWQNGLFPKADPKISGPYRVENTHFRWLETINPSFRFQRSLGHLPNNLLREVHCD